MADGVKRYKTLGEFESGDEAAMVRPCDDGWLVRYEDYKQMEKDLRIANRLKGDAEEHAGSLQTAWLRTIKDQAAKAALFEMAIEHLRGMSNWDQCSPDKAAAIRKFLQTL